MDLCSVFLRVSSVFEPGVFVSGIAVSVLLIMNAFFGAITREVFFSIMAPNEKPNLSKKNLLHIFLILSLWGIIGTLVLLYLTNLWNESPFK